MSHPSSCSSPVESSVAEAESTSFATVTIGEYRVKPLIQDIGEIKRLPSTRTIIENNFEKIATEIQKFGENEALPKRFYKDWQDLHNRYIRHLDRSRNVAAKSREDLNGLTKILPILEALGSKRPDVGGEVEAAISEYLENIDTLEDEGWNVKSGFLRIKVGVAGIRKRLEQSLKEEEQKNTGLERRIKQLEDQLQTTSAFFAKCGDDLNLKKENFDHADTFRTAMSTAGYQEETAATDDLAEAAPDARIGMLVAGLRAISSDDADKVEEYAMEHDKNLLELNRLKLEQSQLFLKVGELLGGSRMPFQQMADRLGALEGIWQRVWVDSDDFRDNLDTLNTSTSRLFRKNAANAIMPLHDKLGLTLDEYIHAYDLPTTPTEPMNV